MQRANKRTHSKSDTRNSGWERGWRFPKWGPGGAVRGPSNRSGGAARSIGRRPSAPIFPRLARAILSHLQLFFRCLKMHRENLPDTLKVCNFSLLSIFIYYIELYITSISNISRTKTCTIINQMFDYWFYQTILRKKFSIEGETKRKFNIESTRVFIGDYECALHTCTFLYERRTCRLPCYRKMPVDAKASNMFDISTKIYIKMTIFCPKYRGRP